jgi:uncharacterized protein (TIGR03086 family)
MSGSGHQDVVIGATGAPRSMLGADETGGNMDAYERIEKATALAGEAVGNIKPDQLSEPTPCSEFDVKALLNHLFAGLEMLQTAASGGKGGDVDREKDRVGEGGDLGEAYDTRRQKLLDTLKADPEVFNKSWSMPFGDMPGAMMAGIAFMEHLTHTWDVRKATGQATELPGDLVTELDSVVRPMDAMLRMPGVCGAPVDVPDSASATDKLMAFLGRQP